MDKHDAHHQTAVAELVRMNEAKTLFILPAVVLSEVLVGSARQGDDTVELRRAMLAEAFGRARVIDEEVGVRAVKLRARHQSLRLPDALVIATGIVDDVDTVLTADKRWAGIDDRVQVLG
ncbi:type II toxin-antitoxin system VapC family toxin [Kutzneria sp. NPDC052558]|uniref:type II toxin-antitoxin system VapC family toxin n=1 Tax=Kutzneria sp. NPDC052558 TaxID=3364121 RepID=UPI0037CAAE15